MQEDLEVTGISRSGRVRKKSSKLMDFESPDDIETRYRRQTPVKSYANFRQDEQPDFSVPEPQRQVHLQVPVEDTPGTASGSESDYYENNAENAESMESDGSQSSDWADDGPARQTPANSLYMMEKSAKKKLVVKDGRIVARVKAQRKDKGKTRITAYMMWAKEARHDVIRKHPDMDFSAISKRLGEMWSNVNYNERYVWKRKAKRFSLQKEQSNHTTNKIISNLHMRPTPHAGPGRPPRTTPKPLPPAATPQQAIVPASPAAPSNSAGGFRVSGCGAIEVAAHLRLLGESLAIIGERLKEHEGQIAVSGSVSVLLDTLLCSLAPLLSVCRALPAIAPPAALLQDTLHNIAYIMPGL